MSEGRLIRNLLPFERHFTQIPNSWLRDGRLSFKARGLLAMLMSHEHGWKITMSTIVNDAERDGKDSVLTAVRELEDLGYLVRHARRDSGRFTVYDWELADPSGLSDPALFGRGAVGITPPKRNNRRGRTATGNPRDTGAENPPPSLRTQVEDIKSSQGESRPRTRECPVSERISPSGEHVWLPTGVCLNCPAQQRSAVLT